MYAKFVSWFYFSFLSSHWLVFIISFHQMCWKWISVSGSCGKTCVCMHVLQINLVIKFSINRDKNVLHRVLIRAWHEDISGVVLECKITCCRIICLFVCLASLHHKTTTLLSTELMRKPCIYPFPLLCPFRDQWIVVLC